MSEPVNNVLMAARPDVNNNITVQRYQTLDGRSGRFVFKNGVVAHFVNGIYRTNQEYQIEELNEMVMLGRFQIPAETTEVYDGEDPLSALKAKIRAELEAERAPRKETVLPDTTYDPGRLTPTSTRDLHGLSGMSTSVESGVASSAPTPAAHIKVGGKK